MLQDGMAPQRISAILVSLHLSTFKGLYRHLSVAGSTRAARPLPTVDSRGVDTRHRQRSVNHPQLLTKSSAHSSPSHRTVLPLCVEIRWLALYDIPRRPPSMWLQRFCRAKAVDFAASTVILTDVFTARERLTASAR